MKHETVVVSFGQSAAKSFQLTSVPLSDLKTLCGNVDIANCNVDGGNQNLIQEEVDRLFDSRKKGKRS